MNIFLVATSTILNLPKPKLAEHVLFSKFAYPKKCFAWYQAWKRKELKKAAPARCPWVDNAMATPPVVCGRLLKKGRKGYCNKHTRVMKGPKK